MDPRKPEGHRPTATARQRLAFLYRRMGMRGRRLVQRISWAPLGRRVREPVFIIGAARSGKSLLKACLGEHPHVAAYPGEANHLWHPDTHLWMFSRHRGDVPPFWADPAAYTRKSTELRSQRQAEHIKTVFGMFALRRGGGTFLNDSAKTTFLVPFIRTLFPDARFLHVLRDGRCVVHLNAGKISRKIESHRWIYSRYGFALEGQELVEVLARFWRDQVDEVRSQGRDPSSDTVPPPILEVRYEDLCRSPTAELQRIVRFMGLDPARLPPSPPIRLSDQNSDILSRLAPETTERMMMVLGPTLSEFGYS